MVHFDCPLTAEKDGIAETMNDSDKIYEIQCSLTDNDRSFLNTAVPYVRIPGRNALAVHAGIGQNIRKLPAPEELLAMPRTKKKYIQSMLLRLRYEDRDGNFVALGNETTIDQFWAKRYDARFGHVYFGHHAFPEKNRPVEFEHATSLDLGCVYGGCLAAAVLDGTSVQYEVVRAKKCYANSSI